MKVHKLKTWPMFFEAILDGRKRFELRKDDRGFSVGDFLILQEWDPDKADALFHKLKTGATSIGHGEEVEESLWERARGASYTGREITAIVRYCLPARATQEYLVDGTVCMGIEVSHVEKRKP